MPPSKTASPGILYGDTLYLSAKDGFIPGQGMVTPLFDLQLRQSMRNLLDGLQEVDMDFSNVVFSTVYLRQMKDDNQMSELYTQVFQASVPRKNNAAAKSRVRRRGCRADFFHRRTSTGRDQRGLTMNRRSFVKWATAFPLLAQVGWQQALGTGWAEVARNSTDNIYTRLA